MVDVTEITKLFAKVNLTFSPINIFATPTKPVNLIVQEKNNVQLLY